MSLPFTEIAWRETANAAKAYKHKLLQVGILDVSSEPP